MPQVLGLDREQVAWVELLPEEACVFTCGVAYDRVQGGSLTGGGALSCFMVSREELEHTYALPNAFNAYTKLIG